MARRYTKPSLVNAPLRAARVLKSMLLISILILILISISPCIRFTLYLVCSLTSLHHTYPLWCFFALFLVLFPLFLSFLPCFLFLRSR